VICIDDLNRSIATAKETKMTSPFNNRLSRTVRATLFTLALGLPILPIVAAADQPGFSSGHDSQVLRSGSAPLVEKVFDATKKYININVALNELPEHWVPATPCVSGPNEGAMGVHLIKGSRVGDGEVKGDEPEALIYEPLSDGKFRLVGVEFIVIAEDWANKHGPDSRPDVDGHLMNFVDAPNRYGLKPFYELHVWAFEHNPKGNFADWNTQVSCDRQTAN
jgi:hypothetical protein